MEKSAAVFDIFRGTTHDGPGLRTTVFFAGCPLHCAWCHNPEGIALGRKVWWDKRTCIGCMLCHAACKTGANIAGEDGFVIDDPLCSRCGACVRACPAQAMTFTSRTIALDALVDEVMRDKAFYDKTGGGVTASGGECMLKPAFLKDFFSELSRRGVDTAVDTCGMVPYESFEKVLPYTRHVLYDLKFLDSAMHQKHTGQGNDIILENVRRIAKGIAQGRLACDLWIRTPLIPDATATPENIAAIGSFLARELYSAVSRWELCAFNNSCAGKYERLGLAWTYRDKPLLSGAVAQALMDMACSCGFPNDRVALTGIIAQT